MIPGTLSVTGRAPMVSAPGQVAVRSGSTALMMTGASDPGHPARVEARAYRQQLHALLTQLAARLAGDGSEVPRVPARGAS